MDFEESWRKLKSGVATMLPFVLFQAHWIVSLGDDNFLDVPVGLWTEWSALRNARNIPPRYYFFSEGFCQVYHIACWFKGLFWGKQEEGRGSCPNLSVLAAALSWPP
jgi:hypothetical protein